MAISLETLYKPVNDFFLKKFQTSVGSPIFFRFQKHGSNVSEDDFIDPPNNPEEEFSDFVNRVPVEEDSDGLTILFLTKGIDESYRFEFLPRALPFIPQNSDEFTREAIEKAFNEIHSNAINKYDEKGWQARRGVADKFWASYAIPSNWYQRTNNETWENFSFQATEPDLVSVSSDAKSQLWKLRMDDTQLQKAIPILNANKAIKPIDLQTSILVKSQPLGGTQVVDRRISSTIIRRPGYVFINNHWERERPATTVIGKKMVPTQTAQQTDIKVRTHVQQKFRNAYLGLSFNNKIKIANYIKDNAPTKAVESNNFTISFDFCKVDIRRPWLSDVFLESNSWYIPGHLKGDLSNPGTLSLLPVSFVAVKNLKIKANWSSSDIKTAVDVTDFGPFQVDAKIDESGIIRRDGIQVMGWLLQKMPILPPNNPPY